MRGPDRVSHPPSLPVQYQRHCPPTAAPRRRGPCSQAANSGVSLGRQVNLRPPIQAETAPRRRGPSGRRCSGVASIHFPFSTVRSTSAPLSSNSRTASTWPFSQATIAALRRPPSSGRLLVEEPHHFVDVACLGGGVRVKSLEERARPRGPFPRRWPEVNRAAPLFVSSFRRRK